MLQLKPDSKLTLLLSAIGYSLLRRRQKKRGRSLKRNASSKLIDRLVSELRQKPSTQYSGVCLTSTDLSTIAGRLRINVQKLSHQWYKTSAKRGTGEGNICYKR